MRIAFNSARLNKNGEAAGPGISNVICAAVTAWADCWRI
jgi:hypothetical protein